MVELSLLWGTVIWYECPCGTKVGFCKKPTSQVKEVPHWASSLQQCILIGVEERTAQRDLSVSWCPVSFWGTERTLFSSIAEGSLFTRSHLKPSLNWKWKKNISEVILPIFSHHKKSVYKHVKCKRNIFRKNTDKNITYLGGVLLIFGVIDLTSNFNVFCKSWRDGVLHLAFSFVNWNCSCIKREITI